MMSMVMMLVITMLIMITLVTFYHPDDQGDHWDSGRNKRREATPKQTCASFTVFTVTTKP